ncbi:MAG: dTDP-4-dehydrorhamnose reductase [Nitrosomonadales bacterium]|nr:dTDP-4-dehydrorhamnose reductase [Nitrosomonadales bacterium]
MRTILLTGKSGQIGRELHRTLAALGRVVAPGRDQLDLADPDAIRLQIRRTNPGIIVNAAAYTAVDQAESEPDLAMAVNGMAPGVMAEEAARLNALLVHYSTDYVFDGTKSTPYTEQDTPNPLNAYGRSKLMGERMVCAQTSHFLIFRSTWVYDAQGKNFLNTIKRIGAQRSELTIVDDQLGAPTWSREIAQATVQAIALYLADPDPEQINGIYHMTAQGQTSWFGFAQAAAGYGLFAGLACPPALRAISSAEFSTPVKRPRYSVLSNAKLLNQFGIQLPDWKVSLRECLANQ